MNALHYAAYFDVPELIRVLLKASKPKGEFQKQTVFIFMKASELFCKPYSHTQAEVENAKQFIHLENVKYHAQANDEVANEYLASHYIFH